VPSTLFIDEKDLSKLISCVLLNAIKFTEHSEGRVKVEANLSRRSRYIIIKVSDNGPGIPAAFLPKLFKPFSQENASTTRSIEGLGLGLMVAKGIARKLGGDLLCTRAETSGPEHGSDFEIKIPLQAGETISRPGSPFHSPMPRRAELNIPLARTSPLPPANTNTRELSRALYDVVGPPLFYSPPDDTLQPRTPPSPMSCLDLVSIEAAAASGTTTRPDTPPSPVSSNDALPAPEHRRRYRKPVASNPEIDRDLASKYPLNFLVAEDNKINRKLLVSMLSKFGYKTVLEAHDGTEAVRQMSVSRPSNEQIDVILMDLWMPLMDGYEATERILGKRAGYKEQPLDVKRPTVLAVTADVTDGALERAAQVGMKGYMTKPYKLMDLQRLITEYCASSKVLVDRSESQDAIGNGNVEAVAQDVSVQA
jgi:CheY-like chemotaxis protein